MSYYNTTNECGLVLIQSRDKAQTQQEVIAAIFEESIMPLSPSQVQQITELEGFSWPLTSIRRAMTNLTKQGYLLKTDLKVTGLYKVKEFLWTVTTERAA